MKPTILQLRKQWTIVVLAIALVFNTQAQIYYTNFVRSDRQWEFDVSAGPSNFLGDVGGNRGPGKLLLKDLNFQATKMFYGASVTYYPNQWLGIKANINMGQVSGFDSLITYQGSVERDRKNRNLGFRSNIVEANLMAEVYPLAFISRKEAFFNSKLRPYFNVGVGLFNFNPQGIYEASNGTKTWVDLRPLRLEGQGMSEYPDRKEYKTTAFQIPFGFGIKYFFNEQWYFGAEVMQRFTFTDYVDDVSKTYINPELFKKYLPKELVPVAEQMMFKRALVNHRPVTDFIDRQRGDPSDNDYYLSVFLKLGFKFGGRDCDFSCSTRRKYRGYY